MAPRFIISGTGLRAGRTTVGCALAFAAKVRALRVGVMKPAATGCVVRDGLPAADDAAALIAAGSADFALEFISPYRYRSPLTPIEAAQADGVAAPDFAIGVAAPDFTIIDRTLGQIESRSDMVIVEDTHGLATRLDGTNDFADLAIAHGLELILVVARRAGYLDDAIAALDFAQRRKVRIRGAILNALAPATPTDINREANALAHAIGAPLLGKMRFKEPLSLAIVEQLL
jgi:dethiobiotin synthetase